MSLLGLDVGTTGCKAAAYSAEGLCLATSYREYPTLHPQPGWEELDAKLVLQRLWECIGEVAQETVRDPITALSISTMGEAMTPVSANREILGNSILSVDLRGAEYVEQLAAEIGQEAFYAINPNILAPNYSLPKLLWLRENQPALYENAWKFLLWGDLVAYMLGCDPLTSYSHANRTLLFNIRTEDWSAPLLAWAGIEEAKLPTPVASGMIAGQVSDSVAEELGLPKGISVVVGGHDQCCSLLGAGVHDAGKAVCGIGTVECITPTYAEIPDAEKMLARRLNVEHALLPDLYASFIYNQSGALIRWFRDTFAKADSAALKTDADIYDVLSQEMPSEPTRLLVLPHFEITGAPDFITDSAGVIAGLRTHTTRGEILKAMMESATFYFLESIHALKALGIDTSEFVATGGGAKSDPWLQIKADILVHHGFPGKADRILRKKYSWSLNP
jgi:xylulokinase